MSPARTGITKFQTSLYDPFLVVLFTKVLSLLKSLHNIPETWALGLLSLNIVYTRALVGQAEPINHQVWPLVFIVLEFLEDSLPINCIFVSLMDVGDPRGCAHDMVLNTGCCRIVIGVRIVHGHAETREQLHFLSNTEIYIHDLSKSLFTCYYFFSWTCSIWCSKFRKMENLVFRSFCTYAEPAGCSINCTKHIKRSISGVILIFARNTHATKSEIWVEK